MSDDRRSEAIAILKKYRENLELFAGDHLQIKTQDPTNPFVKLKFNRGQRYIHERIEEQRKRTGMVRAVIVKGRRLGSSTYIAARFYHRAALNKGVNVFIMSHEQPSADTLFDIVDRFQRHNALRPATSAANVKEMIFGRLDSSYRVATANEAGDTGRSAMITLYHGSEVPSWKNVEGHFASSVKAVSPVPGTEIIFESTAKGPFGKFYELWQNAEAGVGGWIGVFVPWYWSDEYQKTPPDGFELSGERVDGDLSEVEYAEAFGLTLPQMAWRRDEIIFMGAHKFKQEFPATAVEAFQAADKTAFIKSAQVLRARKRLDIEGYGPLIIGVDPAGPGGDRFAVCRRRGGKAFGLEWRDKIDTVQAAHWLRKVIDDESPDRVNIDAGGIGHAVISMLRSFGPGYGRVVCAVNFGSPSEFKKATPKVPGPANRRAEMWDRVRQWLDLEEGVSIPDVDDLHADLTSPQVEAKLNNDFLLESKDKLRKRGVRSPDLADALALTFASVLHIKVTSAPPAAPKPFEEDALRFESAFYGGNMTENSWMGN